MNINVQFGKLVKSVINSDVPFNFTKGNLKFKLFKFKDNLYTVIQQNPAKNSKWAKMVQEDKSIWQIMYYNGNKYRGILINDEYYDY